VSYVGDAEETGARGVSGWKGGECPASAHLRVITAAGRRHEQTATTAAACRFTTSSTTAGAPAAGVSIHYPRLNDSAHFLDCLPILLILPDY